MNPIETPYAIQPSVESSGGQSTVGEKPAAAPPMDDQPAFKRATECMELGLWSEASRSLQKLPIRDRLSHEAFRIRLECSVKLGKWEDAEILAQLLGPKEPLNQAAIFRYHQASIAHFLSEGDSDMAWEAVQKALITWPEGRETLEKDPAFKRLKKAGWAPPRAGAA